MPPEFEIVSVHMQKCAGTSFRHVLQSWYGDELFADYGRNPERPERASIVHGHFPVDRYSGSRYISWVREPAARLISHYFYLRTLPLTVPQGDPQFGPPISPDMGLREFAESTPMRDFMSKTMLRNWSLDRFLFVGVAEHADRELVRLSRLLDKPAIATPSENVTQSREYAEFKRSPEFSATCDSIRELNPGDCELHAEATARMAEWWQKHPD
jgi:hypothetical protein